MKKPTVYLDTSIVSAYWYEGANVAMLARRLHTRQWWELERTHFRIYASAFTEAELQAGKFPRQSDCLKMARKLSYLSVTSRVRDVLDEIVARKIVPDNKSADAAHLAISTVHGVDYLLTWNYAHLANPAVQAQMDSMCKVWKLASPLLVSPESIPQLRFGQSIRRT